MHLQLFPQPVVSKYQDNNYTNILFVIIYVIARKKKRKEGDKPPCIYTSFPYAAFPPEEKLPFEK